MVAACVLAMGARGASAQPLPIGRDGLPGGEHVAAATQAATWGAVGGLAYGHTEVVPGSEATHERASANAAVGFSPDALWMLGATGLARFDAHYDGGKRIDSGAAFGSRLAARLRGRLQDGLDLAAELGLTFPPAKGAARGLGATSPSLIGVLSYALPAASTLSLNLGARLDRSRQTVANPRRLSADDRIAAGISESNAVLLGLLGTTRLRETVLGAEWSWDLLVGNRAPELLASPMRVEVFAQHVLSGPWFAGARLGVSPSTRPTAAQLAPLEPRVWVALSLGYATTPPPPKLDASASAPPAAVSPARVTDDLKVLAPEPALPPGQIRGRVRSLRGGALRADIEVMPLGQKISTDENGAFVIDVPPGRYSVVVRADGYEEQQRPAEVEQNGVTILVVDLRRESP